MKPPILLRPLSPDEVAAIRLGVRSRDGFTVRYCQVLLASAAGQSTEEISATYYCSRQTVRNVVHAFNERGLASLTKTSCAPKSPRTTLDRSRREELKRLLLQSPRSFGKPRSVWTLSLLAEVCREKGWSREIPSAETVRRVLQSMGVEYRRAKRWLTSPDPHYDRKKFQRERLIRLAASHPDWVLGFQDEVWWSRFAIPALRSWTGGGPLRAEEKKPAKDDPDPKAVCCYGLLRADTGKVMLRFAGRRPVSVLTVGFLDWVCGRLAAEGKTALLLVWDDASWHTSGVVREWIEGHNRRARRSGGVRVVSCFLPSKSPWLNNIEPCWAHGKRAVYEPGRVLTAAEITQRVCDHYGHELLPPLTDDDVD